MTTTKEKNNYAVIDDETNETLEKNLTLEEAEVLLCRAINGGAEEAYLTEIESDNL